MKTQLKLFIILTFFLLLVTPLKAQTNSGNITMTDYDWVYDWNCDCGDYNKTYTLSVSPNTPIKINYTLYAYDYFDIYTIDNGVYRNYISLNEPTNGTQTVTVISTTGTIIINLYYGWNGMNTGNTVMELNYSVDPSYTINSNPSIIQNDQYITGKLGIGIQPREKLDVNGNAIISDKLGIGSPAYSGYKVRLINSTENYSLYSSSSNSSTSPLYGLYSYAYNGTGNVYGIYSSVSGQTGKKWAGYFTGGDVAVMSGNMGIGTTTPKALLDVAGGVGGIVVTGTNLDPYFSDKLLPFQNSRKLILGWNYSGGRGEQAFIANSDPTLAGGFSFYNYPYNGSSAAHLMTIAANGKVGIGTTKPTDLLSVNGTIRAKEVKIDLCEDLADYVFNSDYSLMPLHKVEAFVKTNKHLPEIPSAAEVKKKGMNMGEMQNKLLLKIEELTLYVIEQQKQIEDLKLQLKK